MIKIHRAATALLIGLAFAWPAAAQADAPSVEPEPALRQKVHEATWPADIARLAGSYLRAYPQAQASDAVSAMLERANTAMRALSRNDVRLYRTAFQAPAEAADAADDVHKAALGDKEAALRLAHLQQRGDGGVPADVNRYVGWLQFASVLGNERASYELALHYRRDNQPALAATYEARAEELGYVAPASLDHFRK